MSKTTVYNGQTVEVEDCTPTWESLVGVYTMVLENGNDEGKKAAKKELRRMAQIADKYVAKLQAINRTTEWKKSTFDDFWYRLDGGQLISCYADEDKETMAVEVSYSAFENDYFDSFIREIATCFVWLYGVDYKLC